MKSTRIHLLLLSLCFIACGQRDNEAVQIIKQDLVKVNEKLPWEYAYLTMNKMEVVGNDFIVRTTIDESQMTLDQYVSNMSKNKFDVFVLVSNNSKEFVEVFKKSGLNFKEVATGKQSKKHKEIILTAAEIKNELEREYSPREFVEAMVNSSRQGLPDYSGNGLTMTDICIEEGYVCYKYLNDESVNPMSLYRKAKSKGTIVEDSIIENIITTDDPEEISFDKNLADCDLGMKYIYTSKKTGESVTFTITPEMLKTALTKRSQQ